MRHDAGHKPDLSLSCKPRLLTVRNQIPTTVARHGDRLAIVDAKVEAGFSPTAMSFDAIVL